MVEGSVWPTRPRLVGLGLARQPDPRPESVLGWTSLDRHSFWNITACGVLFLLNS